MKNCEDYSGPGRKYRRQIPRAKELCTHLTPKLALFYLSPRNIVTFPEMQSPVSDYGALPVPATRGKYITGST